MWASRWPQLLHSTASGGVVFRHQQNLHFAHFERTQHTPQAGDAVAVAFGLAEGFIHQFVPMLIQ